MKVLVVGGGGREHALVWKLASSQRITQIYCAPGNGGIKELATCVPIAADDIDALLEFARTNSIDLTIVGPEAPLAAGIGDAFQRAGLKIFAPSKEAASLEGSKAFAKEFCKRHNIPTADSEIFDDPESALEHVRFRKLPFVVKADGLAAGKGVIICRTAEEAERAVKDIMVDCKFGNAGCKVVVEDFLDGEEASFIAICDGENVLPLASSQDHKPAYDGDMGPNTGGMGAISPARLMTPELTQVVMDKIMRPTVRGMANEGMPFVGTLYAGLMIKDGKANVLEFNVRFGDPETQPLLARLRTDLADIVLAACEGELDRINLEWDERPAACVVMASGGYPGSYEKDKQITGLKDAAGLTDVIVFHAGTKFDGNKVVTSGGRVLGVTALGRDMRQAISRAYTAVNLIKWDGVHYRNDIGAKALI
ncbi:MAG: phosphoribosylamine--glycine ligase [Pseudomonadota bacterium]